MKNNDGETEGDGTSLEVLHGLPRDVVYCKRCVISNQRPNSVVEFSNTGRDAKPTTNIDENGLCSGCRYSEIKRTQIDWEERERELQDLCDRYRSRTGAYDVVVPGSGGKDSCFVAHVLKDKYGMSPLTVTWAPHQYTEIGWRNFQRWIESGFDNVLLTPNGAVHRLLTRLAFENLCHPFQPFVLGQRMTGPRMAAQFGIPLVMYGEHAAEYGDRIDEAMQPRMSERFYAKEPNLDDLVISGVNARQLIAEHGVRPGDLNPYLPVAPERIKAVGVEVHHMSYYVNWDPQENYYHAVENCGFEANTERTQGSYSKYSSIDDQIDPLHYFTTFIKFGLGRATYDAAQEVRNGKITREEAVALVRRYDAEFPRKFFPEMLEYMNISEERFWEVIDANRSPHLWRKENNEWVLRHTVS